MQHERAPKKQHEGSTGLLQHDHALDDASDSHYLRSAIASRTQGDSRRLTPHDVMRLQRSIGNQAAVRLLNTSPNRQTSLQRTVYDSMDTMWINVLPGMKLSKIKKIIAKVPELGSAYSDIESCIKKMDFQYVKGKQPEVKVNPNDHGLYEILYGTPAEQQKDEIKKPARFAAYILHEMMHVAAALQYSTNVAPFKGNAEHMANMNLPEGVGDLRSDGLAENQFEDIGNQLDSMRDNWNKLRVLSQDDLTNSLLTKKQQAVIQARVSYAGDPTHYDTVLVDLLFYLANEGGKVKKSKSYTFARQMLDEANARRKLGKGSVPNL